MSWLILVLSLPLALVPLSATSGFSRQEKAALKELADVGFRGDAVGIARCATICHAPADGLRRQLRAFVPMALPTDCHSRIARPRDRPAIARRARPVSTRRWCLTHFRTRTSSHRA